MFDGRAAVPSDSAIINLRSHQSFLKFSLARKASSEHLSSRSRRNPLPRREHRRVSLQQTSCEQNGVSHHDGHKLSHHQHFTIKYANEHESRHQAGLHNLVLLLAVRLTFSLIGKRGRLFMLLFETEGRPDGTGHECVCVCAVYFPRVNLQFFRRCEASERENERERLIEHWEGRNRMRKKTEERGHSTISNFTSLPHDFFLLGTKVGRKIELPRRSQSALQLVGALRTKNLGSKSQRVAYKAEKFLFLFIFIL